MVLLEEPESHLHQGAQARLGDLLLQQSVATNKDKESDCYDADPLNWLIETHSPHLIYRILRRIRETSNDTLPEGAPAVDAKDVRILCIQAVSESEPASGSFIRELRIGPQGELIDPLPSDFFQTSLLDRREGWADG